MIIPPGVSIFLAEPVRYLLGIDHANWLRDGSDGDRAADIVPKSIQI